MHKLSYTARFRLDYRRAKKRGLDPARLRHAAEKLANGGPLPESWKDAPLEGAGQPGVRQCRLAPGWVLTYRLAQDRVWLVRLEALDPKAVTISPLLWLRNLSRSPLKTALTLFLVSAATFLFLYNLLEYDMTNRQYKETMAQYWGNLTLDRELMPDGETQPNKYGDEWGTYLLSDKNANPYYVGRRRPLFDTRYETNHKETYSAARLAELEALPHIRGVSTRYMTAGLSDYARIDTHSIGDGIYDNDFTDYSARMIVEATVERTSVSWTTTFGVYSDLTGPSSITGLILRDVKLLAGKQEWLDHQNEYLADGEYIVTYRESFPETIANHDMTYKDGAPGAGVYYENNHIPLGLGESLVPGERYVFCLRVEPEAWRAGENSDYLHIGDDTILGRWPYVTPLKGLPENYLDMPDFAPLRELMRETDDDIHTLDVVYCEDMRTIRRWQEGKFLLTEGRLLTERDTEEKSTVCVVCDSFAETYGLSVGDRVTLRLGDKLMENYAPLGAVSGFQSRYPEEWTEPVEFEIVGLYHENGIENLKPGLFYWTYSENAVFVPQSFLPVSEEALKAWEPGPADVSFLVDTGELAAFERETLPLLTEMGYVLYYSDMGWPEISAQLRQTGVLSLVKLGAFSAAVIMVLLLTVYLFIFQRKKEFAVMRALGCPKVAAVRALLFPLALLALLGVGIGSVAAVWYTSATLTKTLESYAQFGQVIDGRIPILTVAGSMVGCFILLLLFALAGLWRIGRRNPLELLQGSRRTPRAKKRNVLETAAATANLAILRDLPAVALKSRPAPGFLRRYIWKHAKRSLVRSLLLVLVTALLFGAMSQFALTRDSYKALYQAIDVKARFSDFNYNRARRVAESDYVTGGYYERNCNTGELPLPGVEEEYIYGTYCLNNDVRHSVAAELTMLEGYEAGTVMEQNERICLMQRSMMEALGVELGDTVELNSKGYLSILAFGNPGTPIEELYPLYHRHSVKTQIVGCFEGGDWTVYLPMAAKAFYQTLFIDVDRLDLAEYSLADYHEALSFRAYAKSMMDYDGISNPRFSMDTSEADRVYNAYRLIETLYPIAFAAAILTAAILMGLLILQRAWEAALLRVLGTTKGRTRALLTAEQLALCILGVVAAGLVLLGLHGAGLAAAGAAIGLYLLFHLLACALGSAAAAVNVTKSKVLELLQVKE